MAFIYFIKEFQHMASTFDDNFLSFIIRPRYQSIFSICGN